MTYEQLSKIAEEAGFTAWAPLDVNNSGMLALSSQMA